jgi:hypothetical protein
MHFEQTIDIDARQQRVWEVLSDLEEWPQRIETVDVVKLLTPAPVGEGSCVRLKQAKLPEGTWCCRCCFRGGLSLSAGGGAGKTRWLSRWQSGAGRIRAP